MLRKAIEWILIKRGIEDARRLLPSQEGRSGKPLEQARLVAEVMRRVAEPAETLPPGNRAAIVLALAREAMASIFAAMGVVTTAAPEALAIAWAQAPQETLAAAEPDAAALAAIKAALVAPAPTTTTTTTTTTATTTVAETPTEPATGTASAPVTDAIDDAADKEAERVRIFVDTLLWNADAPRRRVDRLVLSRVARLTLVASVVLLGAFGISRIVIGKNLADGKPFKTSSTWAGCSADPTCDGVLLFHTNEDDPPWIQYDLLSPHTLHSIEVENRTSCCAERAIPLVAEVSLDGVNWTEVGRRDKDFETWVFKFPPRQARYVKLHVARRSTLHLKDIVIR